MQTKIDDLPIELILNMPTDLPTKQALAGVNKYFNHFFQPSLTVLKLLPLVAEAKHPQAIPVFEFLIDSIFVKNSVTDLSTRHFPNISPFQLACWNLDVKYLVPAMLECIERAPNKIELEEKKNQQISELIEGISYQLNGVTYKSTNFSGQEIAEAYIKFLKFSLSTGSIDDYETCWKDLRSQQLLLPAHFALHCCDIQNPLISTETLNQSLEIEMVVSKKKCSWYDTTLFDGKQAITISENKLPQCGFINGGAIIVDKFTVHKNGKELIELLNEREASLQEILSSSISNNLNP